ncbi:bifunctional tetrahydrofolate synthase/dihydrofolate synthase [Gammaproteobacteria bacterium LSUCC0112]|nr:bifunctional tetrahydrofolate synthase/dihydrofolate synthase [Gammaproteobacteria bacterium LSUCC0112]
MPASEQPRLLLAQWLSRILLLHPQEIDMGLERVQIVADRLAIKKPAPVVITVTGTNGKGSHVATLDALFRAEGMTVGCYTSPHLLRYNERVCVQGEPVSDQALVDAFEKIEAARREVSLSFFEFGTLAALLIFQDAALDVAVLEVGLGGRLDAVNIIDADIAVVSSIDLDHQEWLGNTREAIAREKAGIFRTGKPVVCAEPEPPQSLLDAAAALNCPVYLPGKQYTWSTIEGGDSASIWQWHGGCAVNNTVLPLQFDQLIVPRLALSNVASALQAAALSGLLGRAIVDTAGFQASINRSLGSLQLAGRQQWLAIPGSHQKVMVDVAHNPHAARALAERLQRERAARLADPRVKTCQIRLVLAMMADKDHQGFYCALEKQVDFWYIAHFDLARCLPATALATKWQDLARASAAQIDVQVFDSVVQAFDCAHKQAAEQDIIVVCGSFITVSEVMAALSGS